MGKDADAPEPQTLRLAGPAEAHLVPDQFRGDGEIMSWGEATGRFRALVQYLEKFNPEAHKSSIRFEPFTEQWAKAVWSRLYKHDARAATWADTTLLIPFTGSYWLDREEEILCPPVTYLQRLQASKNARQKALSRALEHVDWKAIRVIGGSGRLGYPIVYLGVYCSGRVLAKTLDPVVDAHVDNSPIASREAHRRGAVPTVIRNPDHKSKLIHMLGKRLPAADGSIGLPADTQDRQRMAATLHAGGWRPVSWPEF